LVYSERIRFSTILAQELLILGHFPNVLQSHASTEAPLDGAAFVFG
jgi:hypothetical protein